MSDQKIIQFLAEKVMGWKLETNYYGDLVAKGYGTLQDGMTGTWYWNPLEFWADAGMLWEKVPLLAVSGLMCTPTGPKYSASLYDKNAKFIHVWADTVPLVVSKAIATAFGYEWL